MKTLFIQGKQHLRKKCTYGTPHKGHLNRHYDEKHRNIRPYVCFRCDMAFKREDHLNRHTLKKHRNAIRIYTCNFLLCKYETTSLSTLIKHKNKKH